MAGIPPQAYISGVQAQAACVAAGKRLCTAVEWLAACEGPNGYIYPYGNVYEAGKCFYLRPRTPLEKVLRTLRQRAPKVMVQHSRKDALPGLAYGL